MKRNFRVLALITVWLTLMGALAYAVHMNHAGLQSRFPSLTDRFDTMAQTVQDKFQSVSDGKNGLTQSLARKTDNLSSRADVMQKKTQASFQNAKYAAFKKISLVTTSSSEALSGFIVWASSRARDANDFFGTQSDRAVKAAFSLLDVPEENLHSRKAARARNPGFIDASYDMALPPPPLTLSEIKKHKQDKEAAKINADLSPATGTSALSGQWLPDQNALSVEAVLVPRQVTVISSSQDGRIAQIAVNHGDSFKQGDLLIAYDCSGLKAEADIVKMQQDLTRKKVEGTDKLFKLDIISDLDRLGAQVEDKQTAAKSKLYDAKMQDCEIRAQFDGHVTNRLANPGEYTRTDRVLLEVASDEPLQAEFLVPSKWLRWVNVGAPLSIALGETEKTYTAKIARIHGEVDPVSQSIQMIATLDPYDDPLLPGMSGQATIDVEKIRQSGVRGYLEATPASYRGR